MPRRDAEHSWTYVEIFISLFSSLFLPSLFLHSLYLSYSPLSSLPFSFLSISTPFSVSFLSLYSLSLSLSLFLCLLPHSLLPSFFLFSPFSLYSPSFSFVPISLLSSFSLYFSVCLPLSPFSHSPLYLTQSLFILSSFPLFLSTLMFCFVLFFLIFWRFFSCILFKSNLDAELKTWNKLEKGKNIQTIFQYILQEWWRVWRIRIMDFRFNFRRPNIGRSWNWLHPRSRPVLVAKNLTHQTFRWTAFLTWWGAQTNPPLVNQGFGTVWLALRSKIMTEFRDNGNSNTS